MADDATKENGGLGPVVATLRQFGLTLANGLMLTALGVINLVNALDDDGHVAWLVVWSAAISVGVLSVWSIRRPVSRVHRDGLVTGLGPFHRRRVHRWKDVAITGGAGKRELRSRAGDERLQDLTGFKMRDAAGEQLDWQSGWRLIRETALAGGAEDHTPTSGTADAR